MKAGERTRWILVVASLGVIVLSIAAYERFATVPLDQRSWLGMLSDAAAMRWQSEGRLIGMSVEQLRAAFGAENVYDVQGSRLCLAYDSGLLAHIECSMLDGRVVASRVVIP